VFVDFNLPGAGRPWLLTFAALRLEKRVALKGKNVIFVAFDVPADPIGDAFLADYKVLSARYFPGLAHLGITVYELK